MEQQKVAIREMLPHVQSEGVYMCEDLATSWHRKKYGGIPNAYVGSDPKFLKDTMVGLVHQTLDWFMAPAMHGTHPRVQQSLDEIPEDKFSGDHSDDSSWWKVIPSQLLTFGETILAIPILVPGLSVWALIRRVGSSKVHPSSGWKGGCSAAFSSLALRFQVLLM
eukprot:scaffold4502_cov121-Cylindrotheca_fusiformis.AAC.1